MKLTNREIEKTLLLNIGNIAQKRLANGIRLNIPEAIGLLASQIVQLARTGSYSVAQLMNEGRNMLGRRQVIPGVESVLDEVQIEATFPDGTKLVTIHHPIAKENGNLELALKGSFLPVPDLTAFQPHPEEGLIPGELITLSAPVLINQGREYAEIEVFNTADRPIQVGSHYNFIETNPYLEFDRRVAYGKRLNIAAGTSIRFEPGERKIVSLVSIGGHKIIRGGNDLVNGRVTDNPIDLENIIKSLLEKGFKHKEVTPRSDGRKRKSDTFNEGKGESTSSTTTTTTATLYHGLPIRREIYSRMYGPTTGDIIRLADSELYIRVEKDYTIYGDECKFGGGKVLREGMGQATTISTLNQLDTVITNALIVDYTGIFKADVGIKDGKIIGIGKAGNPDIMDGVTANMICGVNTDVIAGEGLILTAGGLDTHVHFICPQICDEAIAAGLTTLIGGGTGPSTGTSATTCTPSPWHMKMMLQATDEFPMNFGFTGKGNTSTFDGLYEIIEAGAIGLKLHEDWGTTPAAIDNCLKIADLEDIQVTIHTDTLNESSCVEQTIAAFKGRTIHTYHTEGAGGGHAPDIITVVSLPNVLPSSTNPTRPLTVNTMDEHLDMLMVCHHLDNSIPEDIAFAESRIRQETVAAEDILHDMGAISMITSDSQAMGRVGEVITRTWQTADKMKRQFGQLPEDEQSDQEYLSQGLFPVSHKNMKTDNYRVKRYIAKYTINSCIAHGISDIIGSIEVGKLADLVLWNPAFFGVKPELIIKGGQIVWAQMGDPNASIPTPQPILSRPMYAAKGKAASATSLAFVSQRCYQSQKFKEYGLAKTIYPIRNVRTISKQDMKYNDVMPNVTVDPETYTVRADGKIITCEPAQVIPMSQRYFLH